MKHIKQTLYQHGGSRIWIEDKDGTLDLIADTYPGRGERFSLDVGEFIDQWLEDHISALDKEEGDQNG